MDILYSLLWIPLFLLALLRIKLLRLYGVKNAFIAIAFAIKIFGAFFLQWLYTYYYPDRSTADIFRFFDDGKILNEVAGRSLVDYMRIVFNLGGDTERFKADYFEKMNAWIKPFDSGLYNDNHLMIKLNSLFSFISSNAFEVHNLIFGFMAFVGTVLLIKSLLFSSRFQSSVLMFISMLPTSVVLINGGLKESVMLFGAGLLLFSVLRMQSNAKRWAWLVISLIFLLSIKPYFLAASILALASHFISKGLKMKDWHSWLIWFVGAGCGILLFHSLGIDIAESIANKRQEFINHALDIQAGSRIELAPIAASWIAIGIAVPNALMNTLFIPLPWNASSLPEMMMVAENLIFLLMLLWATYQWITSKFLFVNLHLVLQICLPILALIGLISPVLGATMRYRAPFLMLLLIIMIPSLHTSFKNSSS